jgi:cobyrinic acid a,c-diamide synthase
VAVFQLPRVVIAGLSGGSGKTLISVGLARAFSNQGAKVAVFKKGPDFVDTAWLSAAARTQAHNLDTFLSPSIEPVKSLQKQAACEIAIIEGNRGLFDGFDAQGTHSTAELAKLLRAPVVLVLDATKSTRTLAALVLGCRALDPKLNLAAVILNRVGTPRQENLIREAIELTTQIPVLGALPRLSEDHLPTRHLGLVLPAERQDCEEALQAMSMIVAAHVDLMSLRRVAEGAPVLHVYPKAECRSATPKSSGSSVRIGVLRDAAFCFYYAENLAALEAEGATLVPLSPLADREVPAIDALYAGGGYPEEFVQLLSDNVLFRSVLAERIRQGLPVWAECGGLMYLSKAIERASSHWPMVGALPFAVEHTKCSQAHGYVEAVVDTANLFLALGTRLRGHEFHYSRLESSGIPVSTALALERGLGISAGRDGVLVNRVFASYMHLFAPGVPDWAKSFVRVAREVQITDATVVTDTDRGDNHDKHCSRRSEHRGRRGWVHSGT